MHELSITRNIVAVVAENARGRRVSAVRLQVGALSGVDVQAVRFCFDIVAEGTVVQGARLDVEEIDGRGRCEACGEEVALDAPLLRCACGAPMAIVAGEELLVRSMEVVDV